MHLAVYGFVNTWKLQDEIIYYIDSETARLLESRPKKWLVDVPLLAR